MTKSSLHLVKLCVGAEKIADLISWRQRSLKERQQAGLSAHMFHTTRMWPRRAEELLAGGALYWVIKGQICVRQPLVDFEEEIGTDGIRRCRLLLEPEFILTIPQPRRPFQGWRYLKGEDAPNDLPAGAGGKDPEAPLIEPEMAKELAALGLL